MENSSELGRVNLAQNGKDDDGANRLAKRLAQARGPSSQQSSLTWVEWDNMADVLGQPFDSTRIPLSKLDQMRRDPMLAFGLASKIVPLIRAKWYIQSKDAQRAAFVDGCLRSIYARYILGRSNCLSFGYSPGIKRFEYAQPDWTYIDPTDINYIEKPVWPSKTVSALVWKSFMWLNPKDVTPHWNSKGEFAGIDFVPTSEAGQPGFFGNSGFPWEVGKTGGKKVADIPFDWALWATNERDSVFGSLYGYPLIGHAYRFWWSYWYKFGLSDRAFEKWADPPIKAYHPSEKGVDANGLPIDFGAVALSIAEQWRSGANIAIPSSVIQDVDLRNTSIREWEFEQSKSEANFDALIDSFNYLDVLKLRAIFVPEMGLIEGAQGQSSRNVASVFTDKIQEAQAVLMEEIDFEINRYLIPQLLEANFGPGGASCTKVTTGFDPRDVDTMRDIVQAMANKHGDLADVDIRRTLEELGIPTLSYPAVKRRLEEIAKQQTEEAQLKFQTLKQEAALKGHKLEPTDTIKAGEFAGVDEFGRYIQPREVINLQSEPTEEDKSLWRKLTSLFTTEDQKREEEAEQLREEQKEMLGMLQIIAEKDPQINLEVVIPDPPTPVVEVTEQPTTFRRIRKLFGRDDEGNLTHVDEIEVPENDD